MKKYLDFLLIAYAILGTLIIIPYRFLRLYLGHHFLAIVLLLLIILLLIFSIKSKNKVYLYIYCALLTLAYLLALTGIVFIPYSF